MGSGRGLLGPPHPADSLGHPLLPVSGGVTTLPWQDSDTRLMSHTQQAGALLTGTWLPTPP